MTQLRTSDALWREGGGYYGETPEQLIRRPMLPDPRRLLDRRLMGLFERCRCAGVGTHVLEVGCGRSPWLPVLARRKGCSVVGLDIEPLAAELARANLAGAEAKGEILCRDAFDIQRNKDLLERFDLVYSLGLIEHFDDPVAQLAVLARYLRPGGHILTTVPNLQGVNWLLQRLADRRQLEMHVIYETKRLARVHEDAAFETIATGYVGFCDGWLTGSGPRTGRLRRRVHGWMCWACSMCCEAWVRGGRGFGTPELSWLAPHIFYVGRRATE